MMTREEMKAGDVYSVGDLPEGAAVRDDNGCDYLIGGACMNGEARTMYRPGDKRVWWSAPLSFRVTLVSLPGDEVTATDTPDALAYAHWYEAAQTAQREVARLTAALDEAQRFAGHVYCTQEIGDLRADVARLTAEREDDIREAATRRGRYMDGLRLRDLLAEIDALRAEVARLRGEPADPISGRELLAALDRVSDETLDAIEEVTRP